MSEQMERETCTPKLPGRGEVEGKASLSGKVVRSLRNAGE